MEEYMDGMLIFNGNKKEIERGIFEKFSER